MTSRRTNRLRAAALLAALVVAFTGCASGRVAAPPPVAAPAAGDAPPAIDNTVQYKGKTLYQYYTENPDTIGWLTIDGIKTDHVVMLGQNKPYAKGADGINHYLEYNFNHQASSYGELYIDYRCKVTYEQLSQNITVYGHHMIDGTMLAGLDYYEKQSYCKKHPYITFHTLWNTVYYEVFAVFVVNLKVPSDAAFNYRRPDYKSEADFLSFIDEVKRRSLYDTGVAVKGDDRIITLSTCTYPTGHPATDDARLVVMGRLCDPPTEASSSAAAASSGAASSGTAASGATSA